MRWQLAERLVEAVARRMERNQESYVAIEQVETGRRTGDGIEMRVTCRLTAAYRRDMFLARATIAGARLLTWGVR